MLLGNVFRGLTEIPLLSKYRLKLELGLEFGIAIRCHGNAGYYRMIAS
jgi:hypothetical protein